MRLACCPSAGICGVLANTNFSDSPLFQQQLETGLHEMLIAGQRICYSFVLHYDEGDTVSQSPIFVRTRSVTLQSAVKQRLRCWNYLCVHVALQRRDKCGDPTP